MERIGHGSGMLPDRLSGDKRGDEGLGKSAREEGSEGITYFASGPAHIVVTARLTPLSERVTGIYEHNGESIRHRTRSLPGIVAVDFNSLVKEGDRRERHGTDPGDWHPIAVGAHSDDILMQFFIEAITLSVLGELLGIALGVGASQLLSAKMGWATLTSGSSIVIAFVFSAEVGIFFGFYPAQKASRLDPIEALRYE